MHSVLDYLQGLSSLAFLFYGLSCLFSAKMVLEFERYGLKRYRLLTGILEVSGALGQMAGFFVPVLLGLSSLGLMCLMICGIWTRWRIRDPWVSFLPALILMLVNAVLSFKAL